VRNHKLQENKSYLRLLIGYYRAEFDFGRWLATALNRNNVTIRERLTVASHLCYENTRLPNPTVGKLFAIFVWSLMVDKCEKRYRFKMATLYEREVIKKSKNSLLVGRSFQTHTTCG
jgi:hypothetical protein